MLSSADLASRMRSLSTLVFSFIVISLLDSLSGMSTTFITQVFLQAIKNRSSSMIGGMRL